MPPKRPSHSDSGSDSNTNNSSPTSTPKKTKTTSATPSPKKTSIAWSVSEEKKFLDAIDRLVKSGLWGELKVDEEVSRRGANGVRSHWDALYKKMKKG